MSVLAIAATGLAALLAAWLALRLSFPLPELPHEPEAPPLQDTPDSRIGRAIAGLEAAHPGLSGIVPLAESREAFAVRVALVRAADVCLDVQYYIWREDVSGRLLLEELRQAAERGVMVRLLLDDNGISGLDAELAALDSHPRMEVRLFNPFTIRRPKAIGYALDFFRLNRRMHNKSLTADNQMTIVGGRNIGDAYFGAGEQPEFADLDVLAIGAIVPEMARDFARYWTSASAYPARLILPAVKPGALAALAADAKALLRDEPLAQAYAAAVGETSFAEALTHGALDYEWAPVRMVSDDPAKGLGLAPHARTLMGQISEIIGEPKRQLGLVSAYFVPSKAGAKMFEAMAARGVEVDVLTNSLAATDVAMVHAGYARYRRRLLKAGVRLWEMKGEASKHPAGRGGALAGLLRGSLGRLRRDASAGAGQGAEPGAGLGGARRRWQESRRRKRASARGTVLRSSRSSLHAKTFTSDGERLFVGSFNFDPRSMHLNTELGFLMDSPTLALRLQQVFSDPLRHSAYELRLGPGGALQWLEEGEAGTLVHTHEPETGRFRRAQVVFWGLMPIEWLL